MNFSIIVFFLSVWILCTLADSNNVASHSLVRSPFGIPLSFMQIRGGTFTNDCCAVTSTFTLNDCIPRDHLRFRTSIPCTLLNLRGGDFSFDENEDEENEDEYEYETEDEREEEEYDEDEDDIFSTVDLDSCDTSDFKEENLVDRFIEIFHSTPPLTKAYLTSSFVVTFSGAIFTQNEFPPLLTLEWKKVLKQFQIWRPFTAFLNFGSFGILGYPLTIHFVHQYMSSLERASHNKPYDFWIMILFGMTSMLVGYPIMKLNARFLGHNISTFLTYIWSRMYEGMDVGVFDFLHIKAEVLPWFMLAQTFLLEGEPPTLDFLGIVFGHVYYHFRKMGMLTAPDWLIEWYNESPTAKILRDKYKTIAVDY